MTARLWVWLFITTIKLKKDYRKQNCGQSFFEVTVAFALVAIILVSLVALASVSIRNATSSKNKTLANRFGTEAVEWLKSQKDNNWNTFTTNVTIPSWCFINLSWSKSGSCGASDFIANTPFLRSGSFTIIDANTVQANIKVSWNDLLGYHEISNSTIFTNWKAK